MRRSTSDDDRVELLLREHGPRLRRYIHRLASPGVDVDDILQEVFIAAWRQTKDFLAAEIPLAWLFTVANRRWKDAEGRRARRLKAEGKCASLHDDVHEPDFADQVEAGDRLDDVVAAFRSLRYTDRQLIQLAIEEFDGETIARIKGWSVTKVYQRVYRARQRLKAKPLEIRLETRSQEPES